MKYNITLIGDDCIVDKRPVGYFHKDLNKYVLSAIIVNEDLKTLSRYLTEFGITPAIFRDDAEHEGVFTRTKQSVVSNGWLSFDYDDGTKHQEVIKVLNQHNLNHIIAGSMNHNKDKHDGFGIRERFHVFVPLKHKISESDCYDEIIHGASILYGITGFDESCKDISRFFAKHSCILSVKTDGLAADNADIQNCYDEYDKKQRIKKLLESLDNPQPKKHYDKDANIFEWFENHPKHSEWANGLASIGSRNRTVCSFAGTCKKKGFNKEDVKQIVCNHLSADREKLHREMKTIDYIYNN